ncbi:minor capsid protein [Nocardioides humi]|uniref:Bacteriophage HK97-gp10, tail-component n=1 Tax=Nocardioides humi TaxID=449461 RepID=A0ABN2BRG0_9ACTN|nr:minor capsid protein [Nocardioides humi]
MVVKIDVSKALRGVREGATKGVTLAVEHVLSEANKHVPHDEGTLERSGATVVGPTAKGVRGVVSYDTPYAVKQHEDMTLNHHGKGQAKWLENTLAAERQTVGKIIATAISKELGS